MVRNKQIERLQATFMRTELTDLELWQQERTRKQVKRAYTFKRRESIEDAKAANWR